MHRRWLRIVAARIERSPTIPSDSSTSPRRETGRTRAGVPLARRQSGGGCGPMSGQGNRMPDRMLIDVDHRVRNGRYTPATAPPAGRIWGLVYDQQRCFPAVQVTNPSAAVAYHHHGRARPSRYRHAGQDGRGYACYEFDWRVSKQIASAPHPTVCQFQTASHGASPT